MTLNLDMIKNKGNDEDGVVFQLAESQLNLSALCSLSLRGSYYE